NLSFPGRYLVLMPFSDHSGISRKIENPKERERLRKILRELDVPEGFGVIIRTVGEGQRARYFVRDLRFLLDQWAKVEQAIRENAAPCRLFEEPDLVERTVRDFLIDENEALVAIDVNTGRNKGGRDVEKTILQTNLEAADEIARQLRLRNIGGLIISDFIDMKSRRDQQAVYNLMKERLTPDKAR